MRREKKQKIRVGDIIVNHSLKETDSAYKSIVVSIDDKTGRTKLMYPFLDYTVIEDEYLTTDICWFDCFEIVGHIYYWKRFNEFVRGILESK